MACEVPVIASRVGGVPEVVEDGVSGILHAPDAVVEMAESAIGLLSDPARHRQFAAAARQRVVDRFCTACVVPMYESCYEEVLAGGMAGR
jgi:glycosyltransferase involved in cell wall biosynthesis